MLLYIKRSILKKYLLKKHNRIEMLKEKKKLFFFLLILLLTFLIFLYFNKNKVFQEYYLLKSKNLETSINLRNKINKFNLKKCFTENLNKIGGKKILVIGHAYGNSEERNDGVYPKLLDFLDKQKKQFDLILIAGDLVRTPSKENYSLAIKQLSKFSNKILISPGNHDVGNKFVDDKRTFYKKYFGKFYDYTILNNILILSLDTNINSTIDKNQFEWVKKIIKANQEIDTIIVVTHQIPWRYLVKNKLLLDKHNRWEIVTDKYNQLVKFNIVMNYFQETNKNLYFFSGSPNNYNYLFCYKNKNYIYINTGVGVNKINSIVMLNLIKSEIKMEYHLF